MRLFKVTIEGFLGVWYISALNGGEAYINFLCGEYITADVYEAFVDSLPGPEDPTFEEAQFVEILVEEVK